jgi:transcriptional regulator with XRE-family HTH domain
MTLEELSYKSGVSVSYISRLENDNIIRDRSPNLKTLLKIAIALSVCPSDILTYECDGCEQNDGCNKRQYLEDDNEDFYDNNLIYYL